MKQRESLICEKNFYVLIKQLIAFLIFIFLIFTAISLISIKNQNEILLICEIAIAYFALILHSIFICHKNSIKTMKKINIVYFICAEANLSSILLAVHVITFFYSNSNIVYLLQCVSIVCALLMFAISLILNSKFIKPNFAVIVLFLIGMIIYKVFEYFITFDIADTIARHFSLTEITDAFLTYVLSICNIVMGFAVSIVISLLLKKLNISYNKFLYWAISINVGSISFMVTLLDIATIVFALLDYTRR